MSAPIASDITIVFLEKNEAENLCRAIPLVYDLGPIMVVDSASTDATVAVALELGADVVEFNSNGTFP